MFSARYVGELATANPWCICGNGALDLFFFRFVFWSYSQNFVLAKVSRRTVYTCVHATLYASAIIINTAYNMRGVLEHPELHARYATGSPRSARHLCSYIQAGVVSLSAYGGRYVLLMSVGAAVSVRCPELGGRVVAASRRFLKY